jgi:hypothetical protein
MRRIAALVGTSVWLALGAGCSSNGTTPAPDGGTPDAGSPVITLAPGEVVELPMEEHAAFARLAAPAGTEQFVAIVASTDFTSTSTYAYTVAADPLDFATPATLLTGCSIQSDPWVKAPLPMETEPSGTAPLVGTTRNIAFPGAGGAIVEGKVAAVGKRAIVWVDTAAAHPANMDQMVIDDFLKDFDDLILPRERQLFGMESDMDKDGRISLVFTPLTRDVAVAFFTGCDLQPQSSCATGNNGEFLYMTPPANIDPPYNTPAAIKETLAHELGHLIHFNRKVLRNKLPDWTESSYMIEGFGGFTQDVSGFQAGNLYVAKAGLDDIDKFSLRDTLADGTRYDTARDGALRGGSYWFVRFVYDKGGGDAQLPDGTIQNKGGPAFLHALLDSPKSVAAALPELAQTKTDDVAMDFYTAILMSGDDKAARALPKNPCFAFAPQQTDPITQKPRGGDPYLTFHGSSRMIGPKTQRVSAADGKLRAGGAEYFLIDAPGQGEVDLTFAVPVEAKPRIRIARTR